MSAFARRSSPTLTVLRLSGDLTGVRHIPLACQQPLNRDIFVNRTPVYSATAEFKVLALRLGGVEQSREPRERDAQRPTVLDLDPHAILVKAQCLRRNTHGMPFKLLAVLLCWRQCIPVIVGTLLPLDRITFAKSAGW
jgi:hypothetical protein